MRGERNADARNLDFKRYGARPSNLGGVSKQHDVSDRKGQAAGIDPVSGRVWFGESDLDVKDQMLAEGIDIPFYCIRVGYDYYLRKGGRR